jgi:hypothetical protein
MAQWNGMCSCVKAPINEDCSRIIDVRGWELWQYVEPEPTGKQKTKQQS